MALQLVSTVTVGSGGAASIEFTGIPQTGKDLLVLISHRSDNSSTTETYQLRFNNNTSNYSGISLRGSGSAASSRLEARAVGDMQWSASTASTFNNGSHYIANYALSQNKSYSSDTVTENNATASWQALHANLWSNTSAITSVSIVLGNGNLVQHSSASLYIIS